uniref:Uncharacterized protein n=1 Tax=Cacopsylla melanoneura TaxID=428564 RepID=A0A8D9EKM1_9HEMI
MMNVRINQSPPLGIRTKEVLPQNGVEHRNELFRLVGDLHLRLNNASVGFLPQNEVLPLLLLVKPNVLVFPHLQLQQHGIENLPRPLQLRKRNAPGLLGLLPGVVLLAALHEKIALIISRDSATGTTGVGVTPQVHLLVDPNSAPDGGAKLLALTQTVVKTAPHRPADEALPTAANIHHLNAHNELIVEAHDDETRVEALGGVTVR